MLNITEIRIHILNKEDTNLRAYASVTIEDAFVIHGIKVIEGDRGLFVGMPRRRREDGSTQDVCHPINNPTRQHMEDQILVAYHEELAHPGSTRGPGPMGGEPGSCGAPGYDIE